MNRDDPPGSSSLQRDGPSQSAPSSAEEALAEGVARHRSGRLAEAEALYRRALELDATNVEAHHHLGLIAHQIGRNDIALAMMRHALTLDANRPSIHNNLALVHQASGRNEAAEQSWRRALQLNPRFIDALTNYANFLKKNRRFAEAADLYRRKSEADPAAADAHAHLGDIARLEGDLTEAVACFRRAIHVSPEYVEGWDGLGAALLASGHAEEALRAHRRALELAPRSLRSLLGLAAAQLQSGEVDGAILSLRQAVARYPNAAQLHLSLGNALARRGDFAETTAEYRRALEIDPNFAWAHVNLGNQYKKENRLDEAVACYERALAIAPDLAPAVSNLAETRKEQGRLDEAVKGFEKVIELRPDWAEAHSNLLLAQHYSPSISNERRLASAERYGSLFPEPGPRCEWVRDRADLRRLRIGYVSSDFRRHPVGWFSTQIFENHDRTGFEIFAYSNDPRDDDVTSRIRSACEHWREIDGAPDAGVADIVRRDDIDILVDLGGHTSRNRLPVFARRPAPVQVSWLGYFGTTGLATMDYVLMDEATAPPGAERWYVETLVRLPHGRFCFSPPAYSPPVAEPPSLRNGAITFGSFNNISKLGEDAIALWSQILRAMPDARLLLKWRSFADPLVRSQYVELFASRAIHASRLELRPASPHQQMLAEYSDVDIALDPLPFGGGLTTCEALWMGVPVVTLPGDRPVSRQTLGFLRLLGLADLAASSVQDYVNIATALARDRTRLAAIRQSLRPMMAQSPVARGDLFTPTLERVYRAMWERWRAGVAPAPLDVRV